MDLIRIVVLAGVGPALCKSDLAFNVPQGAGIVGVIA
jgi:hypothetical protein